MLFNINLRQKYTLNINSVFIYFNKCAELVGKKSIQFVFENEIKIKRKK